MSDIIELRTYIYKNKSNLILNNIYIFGKNIDEKDNYVIKHKLKKLDGEKYVLKGGMMDDIFVEENIKKKKKGKEESDFIIYIDDIINNDDTFNVIKLKIAYYLKINPIFQHIIINDNTPDYRYKSNFGDMIDTNLLHFNKQPMEITLDTTMSLIFEDNEHSIINEPFNIIHMVPFDTINDIHDKSDLKNEYYSINLFYGNFVRRFYPRIDIQDYEFYIDGKEIQIPKIPIETYRQIQFQIDSINEVNPYTDIKVNYTRAFVNIQFNNSIFDLRSLFEIIKIDKEFKYAAFIYNGMKYYKFFDIYNDTFYIKYWDNINFDENQILYVYNDNHYIIEESGNVLMNISNKIGNFDINKIIKDMAKKIIDYFDENEDIIYLSKINKEKTIEIKDYDADIIFNGNFAEYNVLTIKNFIMKFDGYITDNINLYNESNKHSSIFMIYKRIPLRTLKINDVEIIGIPVKLNKYSNIIISIDNCNKNIINNIKLFFSKIISFIVNPDKTNKYIYNFYNESFIQNKIKEKQDITGNKKINKLTNTDTILFGYFKFVSKNLKKKYKPYSRLVQKNKQPLPLYSEKELDEFKKKNKHFTYELRIPNRTIPGKENIYVCEDPNYKYPGFVSSQKHPDGYCLPECKKKDNKSGKNKNLWNACMNHTTSQNSINVDVNVENNPLHVKKFDIAKSVAYGKYMDLPKILNTYFNRDGLCKKNSSNFIKPNSICYVMTFLDINLINENLIKNNNIILICDRKENISLEQNYHIQTILNILETSSDINIYIKCLYNNKINLFKLVEINTNKKPHKFNHSFNKDDFVVKNILNIINRKELIIDDSYHLNISKIDYKLITGQVVINLNTVYVEINNDFIVPITPIHKIKNIPLVKYRPADYKKIIKFFEQWNIKPVKLLMDDNELIYGIKFNTNYISEIIPTKTININLPILQTHINIISPSKSKSLDDREKKYESILYKRELYDLFRLEVSELINLKYDEKIADDIFADKNPAAAMLELYNNDMYNDRYIKDYKVLNQNKKNKKFFKEGYKTVQWNFGKYIINDIEDILFSNEKEKDKYNKIKKIILTNIKNFITIKSNPNHKITFKNIRGSCIKKSTKKACSNIISTLINQCEYRNNKCNFVLPSQELFDKYINRITNEIVNYYWYRYELLNYGVNKIVNDKLFVVFDKNISIMLAEN